MVLDDTTFVRAWPEDVKLSVTVNVMVYRSGVVSPFGGRHVVVAPVPVKVPTRGDADHVYVNWRPVSPYP